MALRMEKVMQYITQKNMKAVRKSEFSFAKGKRIKISNNIIGILTLTRKWYTQGHNFWFLFAV